ncbi:MAG: LysM peptidoglycan-binding domain-containing protein, partial [Bacteroidota bacterium]
MIISLLSGNENNLTHKIMNLSKTNPLILAVVLGCLLLAPFSAISQQATGSHLVVYGQTLSKIARMYGMTVAELKALNNLTSDGIYPNKELRVIDRLNVIPQAVQVDRGLADVPVYREPAPQFAPANNNNTAMSGSGIRYIDMTTYERQRNFVNRGGVPAATSNLDNLYNPQPVYNQPVATVPTGPVYRTREDVMLDQISRSANTGYDPFSPPYQQQQQGSFYQNTNNPVSRDVFRSSQPSNGNGNTGLDPSVQSMIDAFKNPSSTSSSSTSTSVNPNYPILKSK